MVVVKPFKGLRPPKSLVEQVASRPYDVLSSDEARAEAGDNEKSLYRIIKPEIEFPEGFDEYDPQVYARAKENFERFQRNNWLVQDDTENYYLYAQEMGGKVQYGIVLCTCVRDYMDGVIKKHELTRRDKEEDRMKHVRITNANIEPVFLAYRHSDVLEGIISKYAAQPALYDFIAPGDGFGHKFWVISDEADKQTITEAFATMDALYIADGHHRSAAAALVGAEKAAADKDSTGREEYNYFMAVCFPAEQLTILDYNRVVKDLNGMTEEQFVDALRADFDVVPMGKEIFKPTCLHEFSLYVGGQWYRLNAKAGTFDPSDPIGNLDVDISSRLILDKLLGITDLRSDKRIDFVGGLRGLDALKQRVDSGEMKMALALYPVTMEQIMTIADSGKIMPPKATWFEPKLRSGLVIHKLGDD